ncbi:MAG: hypothetical protein Q4A84_10970 [Neisseria sp.]|uniref:hypothetical protein n=1 Tax=Neisseria sp. TaxID=192066 RepID=UPI0026DC6CBE|nr:hypothetical protein [Neisseria sp.]MDO4642200.1 hypothetical protein [Neisseria sp.]
MNRQQRRAAKNRKPVPIKKYRIHQAVLMQHAFEPIETILDTLEHGQWLRKDGEVMITHDRYQYYPFLPALDGWLEYWQTAQSKFGFTADFSPMLRLREWIETNTTETPDEVIADARKVISLMKKVYMRTPIDQIRDHGQNTTIRLMMDEEKAVIA